MYAGERIFINANNLSRQGVEELRSYISAGVLKPALDIDECYSNIPQDDILKGVVIIPENSYIKL